MKELSIEEKARRYDEAIEKAKTIYKCSSLYSVADALVSIFSELKELEDNRWRNWLIAHLEGYISQTDDKYAEACKKAIAWLEKQLKASKVEIAMRDVEQQAKSFTEAHGGQTSDEILAQMRGEGWSEKQGEQKPIECRQETKPNGGIVCEDFNDGDGYYKVNLAYLSKSQVELIENLVASWQNQTDNTAKWSEEDENGLGDALWAIQQARTIAKDENDMGNLWYAEHWLNSIKDRYAWRPSKMQIQSVKDCALNKNIDAGTKIALDALYLQLLKLKG